MSDKREDVTGAGEGLPRWDLTDEAKDKIEAPETPNFLRNIVKGRERAILIPIQDLTDEELGQIGKEWTANLIKKARRRRSKDL